ncbi:hypothetical protein [Aeromicrobium sp. 179-A 4D2 NHS]|uniref:hypothetical protein n=1 Tax=Aeromicrobium sp. 179-A 4D2 NHS TaxID=3142375 RepID=UPI00399FFAED
MRGRLAGSRRSARSPPGGVWASARCSPSPCSPGERSPEPSDLRLQLVGLSSGALVVLAVAVAWGRTLLVWVGVPMLLPALVGAVALLAPPDEGIVLPFLLTTPTGCGWAVFAFAAWNRIGWTPAPTGSGEPSAT